MMEFKRISESERERKREEMEFFVERKKEELWRMWRNEGDEENKEEKDDW